MSGYRLHIIWYLSIVVLLLWILNYLQITHIRSSVILLGIPIGVIYCILPDIDTPSSIIRKNVERVSLAVIIICLVAYLLIEDVSLIFISIAIAIFMYILWFSKHRRFFHSLLAGIILSAPLYFVSPYFLIFGLLGFVSHIILDKIFT